MIRKPVKDGLGNNVRDHIFNYVENRFEHIDDLVHESSSDVKAKEPKIGSREHKFKNPEKYVSTYTSSLEQAAFPIPGTAPSEVAAAKKIVNENRPVKYGEPDKLKIKKINAFAKIPIPTVNYSLLKNSVADKAKAAEIENLRLLAFSKKADDTTKGIGSLTNSTVKKLKAADWLRGNQTMNCPLV